MLSILYDDGVLRFVVSFIFLFYHMCIFLLIVFFFFLMIRRPPRSTRTDTLFPYTTLFRSTSSSRISVMRAAACSRRGSTASRTSAASCRASRRGCATPSAPRPSTTSTSTRRRRSAISAPAARPGRNARSEERRVGKEGVSKVRFRWSPYHKKKKKKKKTH